MRGRVVAAPEDPSRDLASRRAAVDFDAFHEVARVAGTSVAADLMVLTAKGIVMRADGLRDATNRGADKGSHGARNS